MKLVEQNLELRLCGARIRNCIFSDMETNSLCKSNNPIHAWFDLKTESTDQTFHFIRSTMQGDASRIHCPCMHCILLTIHQSECTIQVSVLNNLADVS